MCENVISVKERKNIKNASVYVTRQKEYAIT